MESISLLSNILQIIAWSVAMSAVLLFIYRVITGWASWDKRIPMLKEETGITVKILKISFAVSLLLSLVVVPNLLLITSPFRRLLPGYLTSILLVSILSVILNELFFSFSVSEKLLRTFFKKIVLGCCTALVFYISIPYVLTLPETYSYPGKGECVLLDLPVKGTWHTGHGGATVKTNYHCAIDAQRYAIDIVKVNSAGAFYRAAGTGVNDFFTYRETIYAPAGGIIVNSVDSLPDMPVSMNPNEPNNPAGNHVVIETDDKKYIFLAHLKPGSILVKKGDGIKSGDVIGKAGNSGNTSWPHLHLHVQNIPVVDNKNAKAFPFRFRTMKRKRWIFWEDSENAFLLRNDLFRDK